MQLSPAEDEVRKLQEKEADAKRKEENLRREKLEYEQAMILAKLEDERLAEEERKRKEAEERLREMVLILLDYTSIRIYIYIYIYIYMLVTINHFVLPYSSPHIIQQHIFSSISYDVPILMSLLKLIFKCIIWYHFDSGTIEKNKRGLGKARSRESKGKRGKNELDITWLINRYQQYDDLLTYIYIYVTYCRSEWPLHRSYLLMMQC